MTRAEAIKIAYDDFGSGTHGLVDALVALGVLKLDEPKSAFEILERLLGERRAIEAVNALDLAGLKIVEK